MRYFSLLIWLLLLAVLGCEKRPDDAAVGQAPVVATSPSPSGIATLAVDVAHDKSCRDAGPKMRRVVDRTLAARIDAEKLKKGIHAAAGYMIRACDRQGKFDYLVNLDPNVKVLPSYNIIRHAGAIYALGAYQRWHSNEPTCQAMRRAGGYLKRNGLAQVPGHKDMLGIWTSKEDDRAEHTPVVQLGSMGLGLVAFASLQRVSSDAVSRDTLLGLGRFTVFMQKNDGIFYSTYDPNEGGLCDKWYCEYYPGEAMLGLSMLYEFDPDPKWRQAAADGIFALAMQRRKDSHPPVDHWALLATARLFAQTDCDAMRFPRELWRRHAEAICRGILSERQAVGKSTRPGDLSGDSYTCRIATRLEGLAAARTFLQDKDMNEQISKAMADAVGWLLDAQIHGGPCDGAFPAVVRYGKLSTGALKDAASAEKASHDPETTEIRIDYVQHTLCALVQCAELAGLRDSK